MLPTSVCLQAVDPPTDRERSWKSPDLYLALPDSSIIPNHLAGVSTLCLFGGSFRYSLVEQLGSRDVVQGGESELIG